MGGIARLVEQRLKILVTSSNLVPERSDSSVGRAED
ncbi:hypothetical protein CCACVL1_01257 [Corchorus capsularis]|uniref:Uncharacterized protein n=1 Tax=Corchorus capsularis TaxID=210143 RepID=A0A1R3KKN1_COCAP|nr:hypothetical protein CCACVL1_01257 [Corchorus capsularis]